MADPSGRILRTVHDLVPSIDPAHDLKDAAKGKLIVITGGGQGAGKAMTEQFAKAGAATIVIGGRTTSALEATKTEIETMVPGVQIIPVTLNVREQASVEALFAALPRTPDVLVNNAGVYTNDKSIQDSDPEKWWNDIEVTLKGAYLCTRSYLKMLAGGPGIILNVSSGACNNISQNMSAYGTCKNAMNRLTEFTHYETHAQGVRCIAFSPGSMAATNMGQNAPAQFRHLLPDHVNLAGGYAVYLTTEKAAFLSGRYTVSNWDTARTEALKDKILEEDLLKSKMDYGEYFGATFWPPVTNDHK